MYFKNNRGFTVIEMIIVIAIIGIVSSVGYTIINNSNRLVNQNKITSNGQQSIKILNKYLSKDLEQCKNIVINGVPSNSIGEYSISLDSNDGSNPRYIVKVYKYKGKLCYKITRVVNGLNISLIENQIISFDQNIIPLEILKSENIYEVKICYGDSKEIKNYNFKVSSRYSEIILGQIERPTIPENPEIDEDIIGTNGFVKFTIDKSKVGTLVGASDDNGKIHPSNDGKISLDTTSNTITTQTILSPYNNNGKFNLEVEDKTSSGSELYFGKMYINQINVVISGDITYDIEIQMRDVERSKDSKTEIIHQSTMTEPGKYEFKMPQGKDIIIIGTITKNNNNSTGKVVLTFGKGKTN